jgi:vanillate O-demethylase ferredoxin subunit
MLNVKVASIRQETPEIKSFDLVSADGRPLPPAAPGSHIDVQAANLIGDGGRQVLRQYSLCQGPDEKTLYRIGVKRESHSRGGSLWIHDNVQVGDSLMIGEPRSNFPPVANAALHVLVAGGIGITPMLSLAEFLHQKSAPFQLHYFVRSVEHAAFYEAIKEAPYHENVHLHLGLNPEGTTDHLRKIVIDRTEGAHLYLCGPGPFMAMAQTLAEPLWPSDAVHREHFGAAIPTRASDTAFSVRLVRSGQTLPVGCGETILEVLEAAGKVIDSSCRQGACGTCVATVLAGVPDHRDSFLLPEEQAEGNCVVTCVSRALTEELVLDL